MSVILPDPTYMWELDNEIPTVVKSGATTRMDLVDRTNQTLLDRTQWSHSNHLGVTMGYWSKPRTPFEFPTRGTFPIGGHIPAGAVIVQAFLDITQSVRIRVGYSCDLYISAENAADIKRASSASMGIGRRPGEESWGTPSSFLRINNDSSMSATFRSFDLRGGVLSGAFAVFVIYMRGWEI